MLRERFDLLRPGATGPSRRMVPKSAVAKDGRKRFLEKSRHHGAA